MQFYSAKWKGGKLSGQILLELIGLGGLTPKNIKVDKIGVSGSKKNAHGFAKIINQGVALLTKIMRLGGSYTDISVHTVLSQGKQLNHPERECHLKKKLGPKYDQGAAHL